MKSSVIRFFLFLLLVLVPLAYAAKKEVKLITYYPAPTGDYRNLTSTGNVNLATASGGVGIGTASPVTSGLRVAGGPVNATGGLIVQVCNGTLGTCPGNGTATNGQIWFDTAA